MSDSIGTIFKNRKMNTDKLLTYGFEKTDDVFRLKIQLQEQDFILNVMVSSRGEVTTEITDTALNEPYTLHLAGGVSGSFVGGIRLQYEEILTDIAEHCFDSDIFKKEMTARLIEYVRKTYGDELEFLWKSSPNNAVWRRKDTKKWYAVLLTVQAEKLGIDSGEVIEILDFRVKPEELEKLVDDKMYYPGYHMNKKHWCTIVLDGSVEFEEICSRIEDSYLLAVK